MKATKKWRITGGRGGGKYRPGATTPHMVGCVFFLLRVPFGKDAVGHGVTVVVQGFYPSRVENYRRYYKE